MIYIVAFSLIATVAVALFISRIKQASKNIEDTKGDDGCDCESCECIKAEEELMINASEVKKSCSVFPDGTFHYVSEVVETPVEIILEANVPEVEALPTEKIEIPVVLPVKKVEVKKKAVVKKPVTKIVKSENPAAKKKAAKKSPKIVSVTKSVASKKKKK